MFKAVLIALLGASIIACGDSSEENENSPKNRDIDPNDSFNQAQELVISTQVNQADLSEDVIVINLVGSLDSVSDSADFFRTGPIERAGDYIVSAGWNSSLEQPIDRFQLDIYKGDSIVESVASNGGSRSTASGCVEVNAGDDLTFSIATEDDSGSYGFVFFFSAEIGEICNRYNGGGGSEEYTYVYKLNSLGDGVCSQDAFSGTGLSDGMVNNLGYSYGKCEDALGTDAFAYCEVENQVTVQSRYYFENSMTTSEAQFKCSGWQGNYQTLGFTNPSDL